MYAFASAGVHRKIITKMGKRLASQFPNLVIISWAKYAQEQSDLGAKLFMRGSGGSLFLMCEEQEEEKRKSRRTPFLKF